MTISAQLLRRALAEDLATRKTAFVPLDKNAQQAAGPSGAPVDPAAAGAPPGGAPAGAPPAPGGAPMDMPPAGGAPVDPAAAAGMPPPDAGMPAAVDPSAGMASGDPMAAGGEPPMPPPDANSADTDVDDNGKPDTMVPLAGVKDFAIGLIEAMKGKKTQDAAIDDGGADGAGAAPAGPPPGPVTGLPGDLSGLPGPLPMKTAAVLGRLGKTAADPDDGNDYELARYAMWRHEHSKQPKKSGTVYTPADMKADKNIGEFHKWKDQASKTASVLSRIKLKV